MGCGSSFMIDKSQKMDVPVENTLSEEPVVTKENPIKTNNENGEEKAKLEFPESAVESLKEVTAFFIAESISKQEWICQTGRQMSKKLNSLSIYYEDKSPPVRLSKEDRMIVTDYCLEYNIPELINLYLTYTFENFPVIFKRDESDINKEKLELKKEMTRLKEEDENSDVSALEDKKKELITLLHLQNILGGIMVASINCTDISDVFGKKCCEIGLLSTILNNIAIYYPIISEEDKKDLIASKLKDNGRTRVLNYLLSTLLNIGKHSEFRKYFEDDKCIEIMAPFLQSQNTIFAMKTLLLLSYMVDEELSHVIASTEEPIQVLLRYMKSAIKSDVHRHMGFSLSELLEGLGLIASNDENKRIIGKLGGIKVLSLCLAFHLEDSEEGVKEVALAMKALWNLAFDDENRKIIAEQDMIMGMLQAKNFEDKDIQKRCAGVLWEVEGKMGRNMNMKSNNEKKKSDLGHIMISYQWEHQATMLKVKEKIESIGYKVWLDIDQMGGSTLEAMASAVEGAFLVLMTVSRYYKDSANCRSEAEYAFQLKKSIIPMMMEASYKPDGWLGFIVGAKFWIGFTDPNKLETSLDALSKEIQKQISSQQGEDVFQDIPISSTTSSHTPDASFSSTAPLSTSHGERRISVQSSIAPSEPFDLPTNVLEWTSKEVKQWLKNINLYDHLDTKARRELNGFVLKHLQDLRSESADTFYRMIKEDLRIEELLHRFQFVDELKNLFL